MALTPFGLTVRKPFLCGMLPSKLTSKSYLRLSRKLPFTGLPGTGLRLDMAQQKH